MYCTRLLVVFVGSLYRQWRDQWIFHILSCITTVHLTQCFIHSCKNGSLLSLVWWRKKHALWLESGIEFQPANMCPCRGHGKKNTEVIKFKLLILFWRSIQIAAKIYIDDNYTPYSSWFLKCTYFMGMHISDTCISTLMYFMLVGWL